MDRQALVSELVGEAYPKAVAVARGRLRRNWVARTTSILPPEADLHELARTLEDNAAEAIKAAYSTTVTVEALAEARPSIHLVRLDNYHLIVRTEFADHETTVGDAAMIPQWGVLQALDRKLYLDELQGLPCVLWFPLQAQREGADV